MNCLLLGQKLNFNQPGTTLYQSQLNDTLKRGLWHHAMDLETEPVSSTYSKELRALITECLLHESLKRPPAVNLAARCERGLEDAQQATKAAGITPDNVPDRLRNLPIIPLKPPEPPNLWINDKENLEYDLAEGTFADPNMPPALMGSPGVIGSIANSLQQFSPPAQMVTSGVIAGFTSRFQTFSPPMTPPRLFGFFGGPGSGTSSSPTPAAPSRLNPAKANVNTTVNPPRMRLNLQSPKPPEPPIS
jgi:hypothetical protein